MAYSPLPTPPPPGVPDEQTFAQLRPLVPQSETATAQPPDAAAVFKALGQAITLNTNQPNEIMGAIAEAAQALTAASAAAVALQRDGAVVCCGRSGQMAPEIGSRLSIDSGVSGECLRTGKILRCDDTLRDYRADPEVCRRLGLRSIAVVPVRCEHEVVGVVEAFSPRTYAFAEEHMDALRRLAALAETAYARESGIASETELQPEPAGPEPGPAASLLSRTQRLLPGVLQVALSEEKRRYVTAGAVAAMLLLLTLAGVLFWRKPAAENTAQAAAAPAVSQPEEAGAPTAGATLVWKPSPGRVDAPSNPRPMSGVQAASAVEKQNSEIAGSGGLAPRTAGPESLAAVPSSAGSQAVSPQPASVEVDAPKLPPASPDPAPLGNLVARPTAIPEFASPVSQGVSQGVLIHRVQPTYPVEAFSLRLEGAVVLQATIAEDGRVRDLKVISGHPILARAAVDAVSQWRYRPFLLNGTPTAMQTQITVAFKAR